ncbi:MAG: LysM peptidoglycan-binding domain-containing protein [Clostridia bacterium]|nr:LysM peptidoglycan-binding domain-containing protein [Clostridia bacterium]
MMTEFLSVESPNEVASPTPTPDEPHTYTVVKGDTLWGIALKFYESGIEYKKIMKANRMKNTIIRPGMVLKIPNA